MQTMPRPPVTRMVDLVETVHGQTIPDPYRWLEDGQSAETKEWVEEQNSYTRSLLDAVPGRERIHQRLSELLGIGVVTPPVSRGGRYLYLRRDGEQNQPILYVRDGYEDRVLLDPNVADSEGTTALDWWYPSNDGRLLAYGYSRNGDEWSTLFVLNVDTGAPLPDRIERTRYSSVAWLPDNSGFFYTRYPRPGQVPEGDENYNQRLFFHELGAAPAHDPEIHIADLEREDIISTSISPDGGYLLVTVHKGWERSDVYLRDLLAANPVFVPVAAGHDALFDAEIAGDTLFLHTNLDAPHYRLLAADLDRPGRESWREIISEAPDAVLQSVTLASGRIIGHYLRDATSQLVIFGADGSPGAEVDLPTLGTVTSITGEWSDPDVFYGFESYTVPPRAYRLDLDTGAGSIWASVAAPLETDNYVVSQEWYTSRDGTRVSIFLVHHKGLDRDRPHPTVLYGYGGFNVSCTPSFSRSIYLWLEHGGIYAVANLRGGSEYGEEWHRAGMREGKQNVFDDFIAAAEHLIEQRYSDASRLAIHGGSNGGLLVGAALTQRPDLFRAVVCSVPLLDMLRYHRFLIARLWIPEYGSADDPDQFPYLYAYSPYHHVRRSEHYPAVLFESAASDTRVDPMHARKMVALLQAATASDHPILLRVESRAGHGIGKPVTKLIEEQTDMWSFLLWQLGVEA